MDEAQVVVHLSSAPLLSFLQGEEEEERQEKDPESPRKCPAPDLPGSEQVHVAEAERAASGTLPRGRRLLPVVEAI